MIQIQITRKKTDRPGMLRHLAAIFYDLCLLFALLFLASAVAVIINHGEAVKQGNILFLVYLIIVSFIFYGWFWTHGGQTLGMRSWKIKLISCHNRRVTWKQAAIRFIISFISNLALGWGIWWPVITGKRGLPDTLSGTYLVIDNNNL